MKKIVLILLISLSVNSLYAQYDYDISKDSPFGKPNPEVPQQIKDYEAMIGECNCKSTTRNQDGTWTEPKNIIWRWKYIMNGMAVQDETLKIDKAHSGSIRQFNTDSSKVCGLVCI